MIRKLAHICLTTDDLPRLLDFYHAKLGLPIKFPFINKDGQTFGYYLACGDTTFIEIFDRVLKAKQWGGDEPLTYGNRIGHFCFEITGLKEFKSQLEGRGAEQAAQWFKRVVFVGQHAAADADHRAGIGEDIEVVIARARQHTDAAAWHQHDLVDGGLGRGA